MYVPKTAMREVIHMIVAGICNGCGLEDELVVTFSGENTPVYYLCRKCANTIQSKIMHKDMVVTRLESQNSGR